MLGNKAKLASLALAGGLIVAFAGAASAQTWSGPDDGAGITLVRYHGITGHHFYHHRGYPYAYGHGYYYGYAPWGIGGAIVGSALGAADTVAAAATGYPYYGSYGPYGYAPYGYGWGPGPYYP